MSWKTKTIKSRLGISRPDRGTKSKPDPTTLDFKFETYTPELELRIRQMTLIAEENEESAESRQTEEETDGQAVTDYVKKELDLIHTCKYNT